MRPSNFELYKLKHMTRSTFSILYFIKRNKLLKSGEAPVYMRITVNGSSSEVALKRSIEPKLWDTKRNKVKGNSETAKELNEYLTSVRGQIYTYQKEYQENGVNPTSKMLVNSFAGLGAKQWTLIELFTEHNANVERLVGKDYSPLTLQRYKAGLAHVETYCKTQYNNTEILLSEVNHKFIVGFEFYLKTSAKCAHNSAMKHVKSLKKVIRIALANDYIRKDPFANYKITTKSVERECLTATEIQKLIDKDITIERLAIVRDLFVFQCYTGLAYIDLQTLSEKHIQIGIDGSKWINKNRVKSGNLCRIPLLSTSSNIINKYQEHPKTNTDKLFPVPSNQKMNAYLKEIATICGIDKELHTHLARHTFATTITLSNGMPLETVSKTLGHSKVQTTQIYAKVVDQKISDDFEALRKKIG